MKLVIVPLLIATGVVWGAVFVRYLTPPTLPLPEPTCYEVKTARWCAPERERTN